MFRPRVIPVLLLKGDGLVKTVRFRKDNYIGDPINAVRIFNDLEADELIFLDITATEEKRKFSLEIIQEIGDEAYMPFAFGGAVSSVEDALQIVSAGAEKVIICSKAIENPGVISEIASAIGNQSVVISIDYKKNLFGKYSVYAKRGSAKSNFSPVEFAKMMEDKGAGEIMLHSIERDGMMDGYDLEMILKVSAEVSIPVIACGGARDLNDMKLAVSNGAHAVAAGSLFVYHGPRRAVLINYPEKLDLIKTFN